MSIRERSAFFFKDCLVHGKKIILYQNNKIILFYSNYKYIIYNWCFKYHGIMMQLHNKNTAEKKKILCIINGFK
jgi:hypothetical protein